jgi:hypothetical protein
VNWQPISDQVWDGIRTEFTLPAVGQVRHRLSELMEDPEPVMRQLVRVFLSGLARLHLRIQGIWLTFPPDIHFSRTCQAREGWQLLGKRRL